MDPFGFRSGSFDQAGLLPSYNDVFTVRPLRSTVVTRFLATMSPSDFRPEPRQGLFIPPECCRCRHPAGSPRFLDRPFRTRCPYLPRETEQVLSLIASLSLAGFTISERMAISILRNGATFGSLLLRLMRSPHRTPHPGSPRRTPIWLPVERAINRTTSFQVVRATRLGLAYRRRGGRRIAEEDCFLREPRSFLRASALSFSLPQSNGLTLRFCHESLSGNNLVVPVARAA